MYIKEPYICVDNKLSFSGVSSQRNTKTSPPEDDNLLSKHIYIYYLVHLLVVIKIVT